MQAIAANVTVGMRAHCRKHYVVLLVDRNRARAKQIQALPGGQHTVFVAVGTGHLTGPDSVPVQRVKLGIRTQRVH